MTASSHSSAKAAPFPPFLGDLGARGVTATDLMAMFDGALDAIVVIHTSSIVLGWNRSAEQTFGHARERAVGAELADLVIPARFRAAHREGMARFVETGGGPILRKRIEVTALHRDGHEFPCELTILPIGEGETLRVYAFLRDISERIEAGRKLARRALEAQVLNEVSALVARGGSIEEGLRLCLGKICELADWSAGHCYLPDDRINPTKLVPSGVWSIRDPAVGGLATAGEIEFGRGEGLPGRIWETRTSAWVIDIHSDRNFFRAPAFQQAGIASAFGFPVFTEGHLEAVLEFFSTEKREPEHELTLTVSSLSEQLGRLLERQRAIRAQRLLTRELAHRVGNALSIVSAIFRRTARNAATREELTERFEERLQAISAAHRLLCDGNWEATSLRDLVRETLAPHSAHGFSNCEISGPEIALSPQLTMALNLVLHELATNAAKYGAFSTETGRVSLSWERQDAPGADLVLRWSETGGPPVPAETVPAETGRGFGSQLIEMMVQQIGGSYEIELASGGLNAEFRLPVASDASRPPLIT